MTFDVRQVIAKKDREIERLRARVVELEASRDHWRLTAHKLSDEAGQLRNERDEFKELYDVMVERYTELAKKVVGDLKRECRAPLPKIEGLETNINIVQRHQEWRRGAEFGMENPRRLGCAIDSVLCAARAYLEASEG